MRLSREKNKKIFFAFILVFVFVFLFTTATTDEAFAANENNPQNPMVTENIESVGYELADNSNYMFEGETPVPNFAYGRKSMGQVSISGDIKQKGIYRETTAFGVNGNISFTFSYDGGLLNTPKDEWHIVVDPSENVNDEIMSGSVNKGAFILQKSYNGMAWERVANPILNYFETNQKGTQNFYTTSIDDLREGTFYRVLFAYRMGKKKSGTLDMQYSKCVELHKFYLVDDDASFLLHNLDKENVSNKNPEATEEIIKIGETLQNESVTRQGFSIDKKGKNMIIVVDKDGYNLGSTEDGKIFTEPGKYVITSLTKLEKSESVTVYIFDSANDSGFSTFFNGNLVDGQRIYDKTSKIPVYSKDAKAKINKISDKLPKFEGKLVNLTTKKETIFNGLTTGINELVISEEGVYVAEFFLGNPNAGSLFQYVFNFEIKDKVSAPSINKENLEQLNRVLDFKTKHYQVAYPTTAGGYIFVCFDINHYEQALDYSREIEKRFIEPTEDGLYYKDPIDPTKKRKYFDYIELTRVLEDNALANVDIAYFNARDEFTYRTFDNDLLEQLESISVSKSINVFPSKEERNAVFDRKNYLNGFQFLNVVDYDTIKVQAFCHETNELCDINYNEDVSKQLTITSKYTITEINKYGNTTVYEAYFLAENTADIKIDVIKDGIKTQKVINADLIKSNGGTYTINCDSVLFGEATNVHDSETIMTIKAPMVYSFEQKCQISELNKLSLYKQGTYNMQCIDRAGNVLNFNIVISGAQSHKVVVESKGVNFTNLYNATHLSKINYDEEILYTKSELNNIVNRKVDESLYDDESYASYCKALKEATEVVNNPIAEQREINQAYINLDKMFNNLVLALERLQLSRKIIVFRDMNYSKYVPSSVLKFKEVYDEACKIYEHNLLSEEEYKLAKEKLVTASKDLKLIANHSILVGLFKDIQKIDRTKYVPADIRSLEIEYNSAVEKYKKLDMTQDEVNACVDSLQTKIGELRLIGDTKQLLDKIYEIRTMGKTIYSNESINSLKTKYYEAIVLVTKLRPQEDYDNVLCELNNLVNALSKDDQKVKLNTLLDNIACQNIEAISISEAEEVKKKCLEAKKIINSDNPTNSQIEKIYEEINSLVEIKNKNAS